MATLSPTGSGIRGGRGMKKAEILAIGSELVDGQKLDTNSRWLSQRLGDLGLSVRFHTTLGDDLEENVSALRIAAGRSDLVLVSGGLGPTQDDLTREALAAAAGVPLAMDAAALADLEAFFARRNRPMSPRNRVQALLPAGCEALANPVGTAPGMWLALGDAWVGCLPGVPSEMRRMFDEQVAPRLRALGWSGRAIAHHTINLFGKGESEVEADALDLTARGRRPEVGITAHDATITFRISAEGRDEAEALAAMGPTLDLIRARFADLIVGEGAEDVAEGLVRELARTGKTLATAESCTGGQVAQRITGVPGVSAYYPGGVVTYSNRIKAEVLGIDAALIERLGAVSPEVAEAMATRVRERFGADLGLGVTGLAGPSGDGSGLPVGVVFLGLATAEGVSSRRLDLGPEQPRDIIQGRASKHALNFARLHLRGLPSKPSS